MLWRASGGVDGTRSWAGLWRDPDNGRQTSLTYDDERDARVARELIEAAGGRADEAARIAEAVRKPGPTLLETITEQERGTPSKNRRPSERRHVARR